MVAEEEGRRSLRLLILLQKPATCSTCILIGISIFGLCYMALNAGARKTISLPRGAGTSTIDAQGLVGREKFVKMEAVHF